MKSFAKILGVLALTTLVVSSVAYAQRFIISPVETNRDLERRIWMLERAVQELQIKVYNLQNQPLPLPAGTPIVISNPKKYFCSVKSFATTFKAYGPTQVETRDKVQEQCAAQSSEMHCRDVVCKLNE